MREFESEYYCVDLKERDYLKSQGYDFSFVKVIYDGRETTCWKYKKTSGLFITLSKYYGC